MKFHDFDRFVNESSDMKISEDEHQFIKTYASDSHSDPYPRTSYWKDSRGLINLDGYVFVKNFMGKEIEIKFGKVRSFNLHECKYLETLEGCPIEVNHNFGISKCDKLKSLKGCPRIVGFDFEVEQCRSLTSLEHSPEQVGNSYVCQFNEGLTSFDGISGKIGSKVKFRGCENIPEDQKVVVGNVALREAWQRSGLKIEDFIQTRYGQIRGSKFGI